MRTVYKYSINTAMIDGVRYVMTLPEGAVPQFVASQYGRDITLWAEIPNDETPYRRDYTFHIYGTGFSMDREADLIYIGTAILMGGALVFHVYYEAEKSPRSSVIGEDI